MVEIEIERATFATGDARRLVQELDQELSESYSPEQRHGLPLDSIFQPHIKFFVARAAKMAIGCGGVALLADFAEIKRMYVRPEWRGRGVADAIMGRLLSEASAAGLRLVRLEAGIHSGAAIRFYRRSGFEKCTAFEPYASMPQAAIITSVFMEKRVAEPNA